MTSPSKNDTLLDRKKAIEEELMKGREVAALLGSRFHDTVVSPLIDQVIGYFSRALFLLGTTNSTTMSEEHRRGLRYRKRIPSSPRTQVTSKTIIDGYKWRKYGNKEIKGFTHPRNYYNCYHKGDQGCKAARQVQITNDDTSLFLITYLGTHTCKPVLSLQSLKNQSLISFESKPYNIVTEDASLISSSSPSGELFIPGSPWTLMSNVETYEGSASDFGDVIPGLRSSFSSLGMDVFDFMDEVQFQKDYDEVNVSF